VIRLPDDVAQGLNFCNGYHVYLIAMPKQFQILIVQSWGQIDQNEVIAGADKVDYVVQSTRRHSVGRFSPVGRRDQVQTARVVQDEALEQVSIEAVRVLCQLKKM